MEKDIETMIDYLADELKPRGFKHNVSIDEYVYALGAMTYTGSIRVWVDDVILHAARFGEKGWLTYEVRFDSTTPLRVIENTLKDMLDTEAAQSNVFWAEALGCWVTIPED